MSAYAHMSLLMWHVCTWIMRSLRRFWCDATHNTCKGAFHYYVCCFASYTSLGPRITREGPRTKTTYVLMATKEALEAHNETVHIFWMHATASTTAHAHTHTQRTHNRRWEHRPRRQHNLFVFVFFFLSLPPIEIFEHFSCLLRL